MAEGHVTQGQLSQPPTSQAVSFRAGKELLLDLPFSFCFDARLFQQWKQMAFQNQEIKESFHITLSGVSFCVSPSTTLQADPGILPLKLCHRGLRRSASITEHFLVLLTLLREGIQEWQQVKWNLPLVHDPCQSSLTIKGRIGRALMYKKG